MYRSLSLASEVSRLARRTRPARPAHTRPDAPQRRPHAPRIRKRGLRAFIMCDLVNPACRRSDQMTDRERTEPTTLMVHTFLRKKPQRSKHSSQHPSNSRGRWLHGLYREW